MRKRLFSLAVVATAFLVCFSYVNAKTATKSTSVEPPRTNFIVSNTNTNAGDFIVDVCGKGVRIRATPSLNGKIVGSANWGDWFYAKRWVSGGNGKYGWYQIYYRGKYRYISEQFASVR